MSLSFTAVAIAGAGFGFGIGSALHLTLFMKALRELHSDNLRTASLLAHNDRNRAADVRRTAADLTIADEHVTRKVTTNGDE